MDTKPLSQALVDYDLQEARDDEDALRPFFLGEQTDQTLNAETRVRRVQGSKRQMAGVDGGGRCGSRLIVSHLADQEDVRIMAHMCPNDRPEGQPPQRVHLNLRDQRKSNFDRALGSADIQTMTRELRHHRIKRRRLSGAGRTGDQDKAGGSVLDLSEWVERLVGLVGVGEKLRHRPQILGIEQTKGSSLTIPKRQRGNADVDHASVVLVRYLPVLGTDIVREIEIRLLLQSDDDPGCRFRRQYVAVPEVPVDTVLNPRAQISRNT